MFGKNENHDQHNSQNSKKQRKGASADNHGVTILTSGCAFKGRLYCKGASRIAGKIDGEIVSEGYLVIEDEANIAASVIADEVVVHGKVEGSIRAKKRVELSETSEFSGDISAPILVIKEGARFNGQATMPGSDQLDALATQIKVVAETSTAQMK